MPGPPTLPRKKAPENRKPPAKPTAVPTPADAVVLAATDIAGLALEDQPFQRYLFTYDTSNEFYGAFCYVINSSISHAATLYKPPRLAGGHLIRIDLRRLWPQKQEFQSLIPIYEELATIDPYFHVTGQVTVKKKVKKTVEVTEFEEKTVTEKTGRQVRKLYQYANGQQFYRLEDETRTVTKKVPVKRKKEVEEEVEEQIEGTEHALHLLGTNKTDAPILVLAESTRSAVPILRADWFIFIVSNSDEAENGRYYQFRLIEKSKDDKSAEQLWLESVGIDYAVVQNIRADQRVGMWRSKVTGKPRAIEYFFAPSTRPAVGPAGVSITRDYFKGAVDAKEHPLKNLLNYKFDGSEAMGYLRNGMMTFTLFDGAGELVTKAPPNLVADRTIPAPHDTELTSMISCIRCHGPTDMWMDAPNEVLHLSKGVRGLNFFDDESDKENPEATMDRLAGLYAGEMDEFLRISRNTHAKATFIVTGGMKIPDVSKKIGEIYNTYRYDLVTVQTACLELGWRVSEEDAYDWFHRILPKLPPNRFGVSPENVTVGTLRASSARYPLSVNRDDWEQEYADAMLRVTTEAVRNPALPAK